MADALLKWLSHKDIVRESSYLLDVDDSSHEKSVTKCAQFCDHDEDEIECHVEPVREHDTYIAICDCSPVTKPTKFLRIMLIVFVIVGLLSSLSTIVSIVS